MSTLAPDITRAQVVRVERAQLKRALRSGLLPLEDAFTEPAFKSMLLFDLLVHLPPGRRTRAAKVFKRPHSETMAQQLFFELGRSPLVRVGDLTCRERRVLVSAYRRMTGA